MSTNTHSVKRGSAERSRTTKAAVYSDRGSDPRYSALMRRLSVALSLLSGRKTRCQIASSLNAPAATKKAGGLIYDVTFGRKFLPSLGAEVPGSDPRKALPIWLGAAWHELGHILWTPFVGTRITVAYNLLEDARIEAALLAKYPRTKGALLAVLGYLLKQMRAEHSGMQVAVDDKDHNFRYAWVSGRPHVDAQARREFRRLSPDADEIDDLFVRFMQDGDLKVRAKTAERLEELIGWPQQKSATACSNRDGSPVNAFDDPDLSSTTDAIEAEAEAAKAEAAKAEAASEGDEGRGDKGTSASDAKRALRALDKALDDAVEGDEDLQAEVGELRKYIETADIPIPESTKFGQVAPKPKATALARDIRKAASKFSDNQGHGIHRKVDHGRVRPMRYERNGDIDTAYDAYEPGLDQEMEVWILLDVSGSMSQAPLSEVAYGLQVGLEDVAETHLAVWSSHFTIPAQNTRHKMTSLRGGGSTHPVNAFRWVYHEALKSNVHNRLVVLYTDGAFDGIGSYEQVGTLAADMAARGIHVQFVMQTNPKVGKALQSYLQKYITHTDRMFSYVQWLDDLVPVVTKWTRQVQTGR